VAKEDLKTSEGSSWFSGWFGQEDKDQTKKQEPSEEGGWLSSWFGSEDESKGTDDGCLKDQCTPVKLPSVHPQTKDKPKCHGKAEAKAEPDTAESSSWFPGLFLETVEKKKEPMVKNKCVQLVPKTIQRSTKGEEDSGYIAFFYIKNGQLEELDKDEITIFTNFK
jgi:hypothetical protein